MPKRKITLTVDPKIFKAAKLQAVHEDTSVSEIVERLLREYLRQKNN